MENSIEQYVLNLKYSNNFLKGYVYLVYLRFIQFNFQKNMKIHENGWKCMKM